ncbi:hypothetical protein P4S07_005350 [Serratia marcescens]|uniref:hypothetical protein n=1 Tax=Serratia marcescens TaxID=615 RepID=UPI00240666C1|nr:hypothetical protein [Serratia marcescens]MDF9719208.1 hypothetical protein [Serratia marcescens]
MYGKTKIGALAQVAHEKNLIILFVFLTSCSSNEINFSPEGEELKNARVDAFYQQNVVLAFQKSGEVVALSSNNFKAKITTDKSGLDIEPNFRGCVNLSSEKCNNYNEVVITGVPKIKGVIYIEIVFKTYA